MERSTIISYCIRFSFGQQCVYGAVYFASAEVLVDFIFFSLLNIIIVAGFFCLFVFVFLFKAQLTSRFSESLITGHSVACTLLSNFLHKLSSESGVRRKGIEK